MNFLRGHLVNYKMEGKGTYEKLYGSLHNMKNKSFKMVRILGRRISLKVKMGKTFFQKFYDKTYLVLIWSLLHVILYS